jgi:hypothetical protein
MEAIAALLEPCESSLGWLVAPTYELTRRIFERAVHTVETSFPHRVREFNPREHKIVVTNLGGGRSELRARSADRPDGLLGEALDFLIVDEAASVKDGVWAECLPPRLIDCSGWALLISTPRGPNWFYCEFDRAENDPAYERWQTRTIENPHVKPELIEAERSRLTSDQFAQQFEAQFIGVPKKPCRSCGGPREDVPETITAPDGVYKDDFLAQCVECGMFVGADGRCIVRRCRDGYAEPQIERPWSESGSITMYSSRADKKDARAR